MRVDKPAVFALPITRHHREAVSELLEQAIEYDDLLIMAVTYWRFSMYVSDLDDCDLWDNIKTVLDELTLLEKQHISYRWKSEIDDAMLLACDDLTIRVMSAAENLGPTLNSLGDGAGVIDHICRIEMSDDLMLIFFYGKNRSINHESNGSRWSIGI